MSDNAALNTDRELYRKGGGDGNGMSYYEPSIHVTEHGAIGMNVGGHVITTSIRGWHEMATGRDALVRQSKAEAMRSQADFFRSIDMDDAADHCEQAALAWEAPPPLRIADECTNHASNFLLPDGRYQCLVCGLQFVGCEPCDTSGRWTLMYGEGDNGECPACDGTGAAEVEMAAVCTCGEPLDEHPAGPPCPPSPPPGRPHG